MEEKHRDEHGKEDPHASFVQEFQAWQEDFKASDPPCEILYEMERLRGIRAFVLRYSTPNQILRMATIIDCNDTTSGVVRQFAAFSDIFVARYRELVAESN